MNILEISRDIEKTFAEFELCKVQATQVKELADKLENNDITIAVIGQFKRGKTTLINSILGESLLPTGIVPITATITRIKYPNGESAANKKAIVHFKNGLSETIATERLAEFISEQENHENERGVEDVEAFAKAEFLKKGLTLVDTPGVGSVHENNSISAYDFAKESDGVIFLLSVDSPINQIEIDFLMNVKKYAGKFYFAVNKIDTVDKTELDEYMEYCEALLGDILDYDEETSPRLIPVSAKKNIGIAELTSAIEEDLIEKSADIMENSVGLKLIEIMKTTKTQIASYREVLRMPPNVFNARFKELNELIKERKEQADTMMSDEEGSRCKSILGAKVNEERAFMSMKVKELFGIEYYYDIDRNSAEKLISLLEYRQAVNEIYEEIERTINSIFMYKEENVYTIVRRIEDINILINKMNKFKREIEKSLA